MVFRAGVSAAVSYGQEACARWFIQLDDVAPALPVRQPIDCKSRDWSVSPSVPSAETLRHFAHFCDFSQEYCTAIRAVDGEAVRRLNAAGLTFKQDDPGHRNALSYLLGAAFVPSDQQVHLLRLLFEECGLRIEAEAQVVPCEWAAQSGNTELMALLVERGGTLSPAVLSKAAVRGHLPLCRWLRQQGVAWPADLVNETRSAGAEEVAAWVEEQQAKDATATGHEHAAGDSIKP